MAGYRQTLNLSFMASAAEDGGNATESCDPDDGVETTVILVRTVNIVVALQDWLQVL